MERHINCNWVLWKIQTMHGKEDNYLFCIQLKIVPRKQNYFADIGFHRSMITAGHQVEFRRLDSRSSLKPFEFWTLLSSPTLWYLNRLCGRSIYKISIGIHGRYASFPMPIEWKWSGIDIAKGSDFLQMDRLLAAITTERAVFFQTNSSAFLEL